MYEYEALVARVIDADTVRVVADLGFDIRYNVTLRLLGINAPEMSTDMGKEATSYVRNLLPLGTRIIIQTTKPDKYGRYLAKIVFPETRECLNDILLTKGYAVPYMT